MSTQSPTTMESQSRDQATLAKMIRSRCEAHARATSNHWHFVFSRLAGCFALALKGDHAAQLDEQTARQSYADREELYAWIKAGTTPGPFICGLLDDSIDAVRNSGSVEVWNLGKWARTVEIVGPIIRDRRLWGHMHQFHQSVGAHSAEQTLARLRSLERC